MSEPTLGEVLRRLDEVSRQLVDLAGQMHRDREAGERTYVRKDVYGAERTALEQRVKDVETEAAEKERTADAFRRQIIAGLILAAVPALIGMVLAINNFLVNGGQTP